MDIYDITVDYLHAKTHSPAGFISLMSEIEGALQVANALNVLGVSDSVDIDGTPERAYQTVFLAEAIGETLALSLIPASLLRYVDDVVLMGKRFDAEGQTNAWNYGFMLGTERALDYFRELDWDC